MQSQRTATLGDVDDAVNELRHLTCQGRELINHNNQRRRALGVTGFFQLSQVFFTLFIKQALTVVDFGAQRGQGTAHHGGRKVGHQTHAVWQVGTGSES